MTNTIAHTCSTLDHVGNISVYDFDVEHPLSVSWFVPKRPRDHHFVTISLRVIATCCLTKPHLYGGIWWKHELFGRAEGMGAVSVVDDVGIFAVRLLYNRSNALTKLGLLQSNPDIIRVFQSTAQGLGPNR